MPALRRSLAGLALAVVAGCSSTEAPDVGYDLPPTDTNVVGVYDLSVANGSQPPFDAIITNLEIWTLTADWMAIQDDSTWTDSTAYVVTDRTTLDQRNAVTTTSGRWRIADSLLDFTMTQGGAIEFPGSVNQGRLELKYNGAVYRYLPRQP